MSRLVRAALGCYPARWRRRHGAEAAELAALLMRDGTPARSVAASYLAGAAREWVTPPPGRRVSAVASALAAAACALGICAALLAGTAPARAQGTSHQPGTSSAQGTSRDLRGSGCARPAAAGSAGSPAAADAGAGHDRAC